MYVNIAMNFEGQAKVNFIFYKFFNPKDLKNTLPFIKLAKYPCLENIKYIVIFKHLQGTKNYNKIKIL